MYHYANIYIYILYTTYTQTNTHTYISPPRYLSIATLYMLDGPEIESRWGRGFPHPSSGAHPVSYTMGTGLYPGVKRPGRGADHPTPSRAEFILLALEFGI
jgi:hypothetical protein